MIADVLEYGLTMIFGLDSPSVVGTRLAVRDAVEYNDQLGKSTGSVVYTKVWGHSEGSILANEALAELIKSDPKKYTGKIDLFNLGAAAGSVPYGLHKYRGVGNVNDNVYTKVSKIIGWGGGDFPKVSRGTEKRA
jgi:hypothetical protein